MHLARDATCAVSPWPRPSACAQRRRCALSSPSAATIQARIRSRLSTNSREAASWRACRWRRASTVGERPAERRRRGSAAARASTARRASAASASLVALVEHLEMAGDVRLEGKLVQQPLAEGVDGLDLQPARRFQRAGEEPARARRAVAASGGVALDLGDLRGERGVGQRRPAGELVEDALRHLGGGRLGEGQAEDARRDRRRRAAGGSRGATGRRSCPSRHWPTPRPSLPGRTPRPRVRGRRVEGGGRRYGAAALMTTPPRSRPAPIRGRGRDDRSRRVTRLAPSSGAPATVGRAPVVEGGDQPVSIAWARSARSSAVSSCSSGPP